MIKLKLDNWKIWLIIASLIFSIYKVVEYGENKILYEQSQQNFKNEKKCQEISDIIDNATDDELDKLL